MSVVEYFPVELKVDSSEASWTSLGVSMPEVKQTTSGKLGVDHQSLGTRGDALQFDDVADDDPEAEGGYETVIGCVEPSILSRDWLFGFERAVARFHALTLEFAIELLEGLALGFKPEEQEHQCAQ